MSGQKRHRVCSDGEQEGQKHPLCLRIRAACPWKDTPGHRVVENSAQVYRHAEQHAVYTHTHTLLGSMQPGWNYNYLAGGCSSLSAADPIGHLGYCPGEQESGWGGRPLVLG